MKAEATEVLTFRPTPCCGRIDFEYQQGGIARRGQPDLLIEAWVRIRCIHCKKTTRILGYCKQAGDGEVTERKRQSRQNVERKIVRPSTGVVVSIETDAVVGQTCDSG